jgi:hypothetical protein
MSARAPEKRIMLADLLREFGRAWGEWPVPLGEGPSGRALLPNIYRAVIRPLHNASTIASNNPVPFSSPFPTYHPRGTGFSPR